MNRLKHGFCDDIPGVSPKIDAWTYHPLRRYCSNHDSSIQVDWPTARLFLRRCHR